MQRGKQAKRDAKELFRQCLTDGSVDAGRLQQIAKSVAESKNRNRLAVLEALLRLARLDQFRHTAKVESAVALSSELQEEIQEKLGKHYGSGLQVSFQVKDSLLGGLRIQVGSTVIDGSVKSRLEALASRF